MRCPLIGAYHPQSPYTVAHHTQETPILAIKFRNFMENGQFILLLLVLRERLPPPSSE